MALRRLPSESIKNDLTAAWTSLSDAVSLFMFVDVSFGKVVAARIEPEEAAVGKPVQIRAYPSRPPSPLPAWRPVPWRDPR